MRVFFSLDYKGGLAYLGMKRQPVMMDLMVTDLNQLLQFMELRLGLHTQSMTDAERLVGYYKCVREYMRVHQKDADNQLYASYTVSPLATAREMLKWRDALSVCGWTKDTPAPSRRLCVLRGVEELFAGQTTVDTGSRLRNIVRKLQEGRGMMNDVTFVMPFDADLLHPTLKEVFALAVADGAKTERIVPPMIEGDDNLDRLKRLLTADGVQNITMDDDDLSVRIWHFKDDMQAEEWLSWLDDDAFDITVKPDTKLADNYLHMMGKPVTGSSVANSTPQIIQLFFTGVALMQRPLNISALLQWLYSPLHPLPGNIRYRLAERLARNGGWYSKEEDERSTSCYQLVQEWITGKREADSGKAIDKKELRERKHKAQVFLPDFDGGGDEVLTAQTLHTFLTELSGWSRQQAAMIVQQDQGDQRLAQLSRLAELCDTLKSLTDDFAPTDHVAYNVIEKHVACLYEPSEFMQYRAQATSRLTIAQPGQMAAPADKVLWAGLYNFEPLKAATDFLTPTETDKLKTHIRLWDSEDVRKMQQQTMLLPLLFCGQQLTMVTIEKLMGEPVNKHPLMVRIEQQVSNWQRLVETPKIPDDAYVEVPPLMHNANKVLYTEVKRTDLIEWRKHESPTSVEQLIQNPIDYTLQNIAYISDNGQSELSNIAITKGNVAHGVIQHLFYVPGDQRSGYADAIRDRVNKFYQQVFDIVVETKGAILLLQENVIERRQLFGQLRECINHLIDIIEKDQLHVVACEMPLNGNTFGLPDDETPEMHGFADMVLARENRQHIIFDFKWTSSNNYYQDLLRKNRSSQLAIYAELLSELTEDKSLPTAYFLMPRGRLFSTTPFKSYYAQLIDVNEGCEGDIVSQIIASYRYRREEIMSGKIEMGEGEALEDLDYFNDTEARQLFPLKSAYGNDSIKDDCQFSKYQHLK